MSPAHERRTDGRHHTRPGGRTGTRERSTTQFHAVTEELASSNNFRSAQDIHAAMRVEGNTVGLATVYRALQSLVDAGQPAVHGGQPG